MAATAAAHPADQSHEEKAADRSADLRPLGRPAGAQEGDPGVGQRLRHPHPADRLPPGYATWGVASVVLFIALRFIVGVFVGLVPESELFEESGGADEAPVKQLLSGDTLSHFAPQDRRDGVERQPEPRAGR